MSATVDVGSCQLLVNFEPRFRKQQLNLLCAKNAFVSLVLKYYQRVYKNIRSGNMADSKYVTSKQANWFAKVRKGIEEDTGKTIDEWIAIARDCPETTHKKRLKWFKDEHGLGINRASIILSATFDTGRGWDNPEALLDELWKKPELRAIYDAIENYIKSLGDDVIVGPRKTFSGFSRKYQFAAARPVKGVVRLGLAIDPEKHELERAKLSDSWSDRLASVVVVSTPADINSSLKTLIKAAWEAS